MPQPAAASDGEEPLTLPDPIRRAFLATPICLLATCDAGVPNVVPVGLKWLDGDRLLLADLFFGKTRANLERSDRVAVTITGGGPPWGYQLKGRATSHASGGVFDRLCELLRERGLPSPPHAAVSIAVDEIYLLDPGPQAGARIH